MRRLAFPLAAALLVVAGLAACAAPATPEAMAPRGAIVAAARPLPYTVSVVTRGGSETSTVGSTNVSDADLKAAVESAIRESRAFREVVPDGGDDRLTVTVVQLSKPSIGFDFTVTMETAWTLVRASDQQVVLRKVVSGTHTASTKDSFVGAKRLQVAVEGAARRNIEQGLAEIAGLGL